MHVCLERRKLITYVSRSLLAIFFSFFVQLLFFFYCFSIFHHSSQMNPSPFADDDDPNWRPPTRQNMKLVVQRVPRRNFKHCFLLSKPILFEHRDFCFCIFAKKFINTFQFFSLIFSYFFSRNYPRGISAAQQN